jgi:patatin-like phospholipase/acyl hydrolase
MNDANDAAKSSGFRILALDGGGIRGIFTASCLNTLEDLSHAKIALYFDLLTGTSSGGIIALALAFGIPPRRILELYKDQGEHIFGKPRNLGMLFRPKHENGVLSTELKRVFEDRKLNDAATPVCIPSYELTSSYPRIWKDDHARELSFGGDQLAWKIALATSAAPLFFPATQVATGDCHVDGGMFANNPTLIGVTEALRYFRQQLSDIRVLSIGTGEHTEPVPYDRAKRMGLWQWKTLAYEHMLIAQARTTQEITRSYCTTLRKTIMKQAM